MEFKKAIENHHNRMCDVVKVGHDWWEFKFDMAYEDFVNLLVTLPHDQYRLMQVIHDKTWGRSKGSMLVHPDCTLV